MRITVENLAPVVEKVGEVENVVAWEMRIRAVVECPAGDAFDDLVVDVPCWATRPLLDWSRAEVERLATWAASNHPKAVGVRVIAARRSTRRRVDDFDPSMLR